MILQALVKYYEELVEEGKVPKPGWCSEKVSYAMDCLKEDGTIKTIISLKRKRERKEKVQVPQPLYVPEMVTRSSGILLTFCVTMPNIYWGLIKGTKPRIIECFHAAGKTSNNLEDAEGKIGESHMSVLLKLESRAGKEQSCGQRTLGRTDWKAEILFLECEVLMHRKMKKSRNIWDIFKPKKVVGTREYVLLQEREQRLHVFIEE